MHTSGRVSSLHLKRGQNIISHPHTTRHSRTLAGQEKRLLQFYEVHHLLVGGLTQREPVHTNYLISWLWRYIEQEEGEREKRDKELFGWLGLAQQAQ